MKHLHSFIVIYLVVFLVLLSPSLKAQEVAAKTINPHIEVTVYSYKKMRDFVAVEIGFTNKTNKYVAFTPTEIYLNDKNKYSVSLMSPHDIHEVEIRPTSVSWIPLSLGLALGIAGLATSGSNAKVAQGLGIAALAMGGTFIVSAMLESQAKDKKLVAFQNNSLRTVDKLPPGITLGGFLYFPAVKKPTSLTVMYQKGSTYDQVIIPLKGIKAPRKHSKY